MESGSVISTWLISWAAEVLNKFKIQECGRIAFERLTGHRCTHAFVGFGEDVDFQHTASTKDYYKKGTGIFVGMDNRCNSFLIATKEGVYGSSGIMRLPEDQENDASRAMDVKGKYADYLKDGVLAPPSGVPTRGEVIGGNMDAQPVPNAGGAYIPRRTRITRADFEMHGYTAGCPGCLSARLDDGVRRGGHTEECRQRLERMMPEDKVARAKMRMDQWTAEKVEEGEDTETLEEAPRVQRDSSENIEEVVTPIAEPVEETMEPEVELESGPEDESERRIETPERTPAVKRGIEQESNVTRLRRRIGTPTRDQGIGEEDDMFDIPDNVFDDPPGDSGSPLQNWYNSKDGDQDMRGLDEIDKKILASAILNVDITEVYRPTRVNQVAAKFGLTPGPSLDLTNGYDFGKEEDRRKAWKLIPKTRPFMIIGSPPCTMFSNLQNLNLHMHKDDPEWMNKFNEETKKAEEHVNFCVTLYRYQLSHGRHFLHEHPWGASSWRLESVAELWRMTGYKSSRLTCAGTG